MRTLYLVRHAKSSWSDPSLDDFDRPLNKRGKRDAPFMAKFLRGLGVPVDYILTSPANRARTTARHFKEEFELADDRFEEDKTLYHAYAEEVLRAVRQLDDAHQTALVFGHNPTFTDLANRFAKDYLPNVPTCGIVRLDSTADSWTDFSAANTQRRAFYYPKQFFK